MTFAYFAVPCDLMSHEGWSTRNQVLSEQLIFKETLLPGVRFYVTTSALDIKCVAQKVGFPHVIVSAKSK